MIIKIQNRQSGKSYDIAVIMKKDKKAICIQPTAIQKKMFMNTYKFSNKRVLTMNAYLDSCGLKEELNVYFDELGMCLEMLCSRFRHNAMGGTHTNTGRE